MNTMVAPQLLAGERILWQGSPSPGLSLRLADLALIPFSLFWTGFVTVGIMKAREAGVGLMPQLFSLPFLAIGLYILAGRFVVDGYMRRHLFYAVTDRRILIVRTGLWPLRTSLDITQLPEIQLKEHLDGSGTIAFGTPNLRRFDENRVAGFALWQPALDPTPQFYGIRDADAVYELIQSRTAG